MESIVNWLLRLAPILSLKGWVLTLHLRAADTESKYLLESWLREF
jgi:hypothetical protein